MGKCCTFEKVKAMTKTVAFLEDCREPGMVGAGIGRKMAKITSEPRTESHWQVGFAGILRYGKAY